jgi:hypothetical protein
MHAGNGKSAAADLRLEGPVALLQPFD